jgi:hypothetical protein
VLLEQGGVEMRHQDAASGWRPEIEGLAGSRQVERAHRERLGATALADIEASGQRHRDADEAPGRGLQHLGGAERDAEQGDPGQRHDTEPGIEAAPAQGADRDLLDQRCERLDELAGIARLEFDAARLHRLRGLLDRRMRCAGAYCRAGHFRILLSATGSWDGMLRGTVQRRQRRGARGCDDTIVRRPSRVDVHTPA